MKQDLKLDSYNYELPEKLIADRQLRNRHDSKLFIYKKKSDQIVHDTFKNIGNYLSQDNLLVLNQSKVFPCRLVGRKPTGGKCEIFILDLNKTDGRYPALIKTSKKKKIGDEFLLDKGLICKIEAINEDQSFWVSFNTENIIPFLDEVGKIPIPPYIRNGESDDTDKENYQTIYAKHVGSVAAPTAGLHFTDNVFKSLDNKGIDRAFVTLHVGLGTFLPVKTENILEHKMHTERYYVDKENLDKINNADGIIAVGTTSLRVLESSYGKNIGPETIYETDIFLYPGVKVRSIKGLVTNFHLPGSTLLMLVSSLIGREKALSLYKEAIEHEYRFFSYGDSMLILLEE